jgi:DNA-binding LacI/PurR family transcriptional regulator
LGHKKIAYLTGPPATPWAHERFEGYRRALRETGIEVDDRLVFAAGNTIEDGIKATLQMLNEGCHPTAVQAVSDLVAIGCAETLMAQGLKIPKDISLVGYREYPAGGVLSRATDHGFPAEISSRNCRNGGNDEPAARAEKIQTKRLSAEIVERKSTAAPHA